MEDNKIYVYLITRSDDQMYVGQTIHLKIESEHIKILLGLKDILSFFGYLVNI